MTPKEEAKRLIERFRDVEWEDTYNTEGGKEEYQNFMSVDAVKECALICVDEMLKITPMYTGGINPLWEYLNEVKTEIENFKP